ncbi:MAG: DUF3971 domain-containing protein [Gammaproteobacteria bacterium]|nr:DUF3971 domain-containing protein [Gammaproteobacteria bacterium]MCW8973229.1 DUF3971 domain-containing protein [Gammaproteobacteria bacterium]MCW8991735.1 DUF3971 domain-containing protein [Gammaproteobacteria bacterium]
MRHVSRLKSFIWYSTVGLLVTLAVVVTVARLSISAVSEYRERFEQLAGDYLGQPVTIASMDAQLVGFKPSILLHDVSLREESSREPLAHFSQIAIALNPLASLRQLSPIIDLTVSDANIVVIQQPDDSFVIQGMAASQQAGNGQAGGALGAWFLSQSRLALEGSRVIWQNRKTGRDILFEGVNLELQNLGSRHRLNASMTLPEELGEELRLALDIQGNLLDRRDWVGEMYLKTAKLKPAPWLREIDIQGFSFQQGSIDLQLWSYWQEGALEQAEGELDLADLTVADRSGAALPIKRLAGQFQLQKGAGSWQLQLQKALLQERGKEAEPFRLQLQQQDGGASVRAINLEIEPLVAFAAQWSGLDAVQREQLLTMNPSGRLETLRLELRQGAVAQLLASVRGVSLAATGRLPGFEGLNGRLRFDGAHALVDVDTTGLAVDLPSLFAKPLRLENTSGRVQVSRRGEGWRVLTERFAVINDDLSLSLDMSLQLQPGEEPLIALAGRFGEGRAPAVPDYLPVKIMPDATVRWLNRAFLSGRVESGSLLLHGRLDKSLLHNETGRLEVRFDTRDVALDYMAGWPRLEAISAEVGFTGLGMEIAARSARIYRSAVGPTRVRIRRFRHPVLELEGEVDASAGDALRFLRESPLAETASDVLDRMAGEGSTPVRLALSIPLSSRVKAESPLKVEGQVEFRNNRLEVFDGLELKEVNGLLQFSERHFNATNIVTRIYGHPASVTVFTDVAEQRAMGATVVALQGHVSASALREAFKSPLLERIEGESDWQARLTLTPGEQGGAELDIYSSLEGMAVNLPAPMNKEADVVRPLSFSLGLAGEGAGHGSVGYGSVLQWVSQQDGVMGRLQRLAVRFGDGRAPQLPEQEAIHISGSIDLFESAQWEELFQHFTSGADSTRALPFQVRMQRLHIRSPDTGRGKGNGLQSLPRVDLHIRDFAYQGMPFGEVSLRVEPEQRGARFEDISVTAPHFTLTGEGRWSYGGQTHMSLELVSGNLGNMLGDLGIASVIRDGETRASVKAKWPGSPLDFSLQDLEAKGPVVIEDGTIVEVKSGAGKLLGLLSLEALPRRLFLDFSDLSGKGLQFTSIKGDIDIRQGSVYTNNMLLKSTPADMLVTGRTGLIVRDFEQLVMVVPNVSGTVSVAGALAWGPQVAAALLLLQKVFKSDIEEATMTRYRITGSWDKPEIKRLAPLRLQDGGE